MEPDVDAAARAEAIAGLLRGAGLTVAVAESLTSGAIASRLGAAPDASRWFAGGVVAYSSDLKFDLLGVTPGPVVTADCAREMAAGVARLTGADFTIAVTGVGGPGTEEGHPAGTVFFGISANGNHQVVEHRFEGGPTEVVEQTVIRSLDLLELAIREAA